MCSLFFLSLDLKVSYYRNICPTTPIHQCNVNLVHSDQDVAPCSKGWLPFYSFIVNSLSWCWLFIHYLTDMILVSVHSFTNLRELSRLALLFVSHSSHFLLAVTALPYLISVSKADEAAVLF